MLVRGDNVKDFKSFGLSGTTPGGKKTRVFLLLHVRFFGVAFGAEFG
jgi:hypothetical protein